MALFCPKCGSLNAPGAKWCGHCGAYRDFGDGDDRGGGVGANDGWDIHFESREEEPGGKPRLLSKPRDDMPYMPYEKPREGQERIVKDMLSALDSGRHIVAESGTGTGKTIVSLAAALQHSMPRGKKVLYLTRTISQTDQVMKELQNISAVMPVTGIALTGRKKSCLLIRGREGYGDITPQALASVCEDSKRNVNEGKPDACPYFARMPSRMREVTEYFTREIPTSGDLDSFCESLRVCPYETKKYLMRDCDVVSAPYVHVLSEDIRTNLLSNMDCENGVTLVIDEAHNFIDAARDQETFSISMRTIDSAIDEASTMKPVRVLRDVTLSAYLNALKSAVRSAATKYVGLGEDEAALPKDYIEGRMAEVLGIPRGDLLTATFQVHEAGLTRTELLMERGSDEMSQIHVLSEPMIRWIKDDSGASVKTVEVREKTESIRSSCIDPREIVDFLNSLQGAIHMSGTMEPLDQYVKVMGLPADTVTVSYPSPFPPENKLVVYVNDVTTKYDTLQKEPAMFTRIVRYIVRLCEAVRENTMVFFTSYSMMARARPFLERDIKKPLFWEESGKQSVTMRNVNDFRRGRDGVLFCVMGGSVAEGMDFPGDMLGLAIVVGLPFPPPTVVSKAMTRMFDDKYGEWAGWRIVSQVPATRKVKQAIGRLIRKEDDRGMAVILDGRASRYASEIGARATKDPIADAKRFFGGV
ncbi:MAG: DEAD/DEAH box helicase family protein [Thermoplasmatales archaeon]|nr:DEAD/DEAH box helicase family protein [Thermoplasmatales archaeon]